MPSRAFAVHPLACESLQACCWICVLSEWYQSHALAFACICRYTYGANYNYSQTPFTDNLKPGSFVGLFTQVWKHVCQHETLTSALTTPTLHLTTSS